MDLCKGMCGMAFAQSQVASTLDAFHLTASIAGAGVSRSKCHFKYKNEKFKISTNIINSIFIHLASKHLYWGTPQDKQRKCCQ